MDPLCRSVAVVTWHDQADPPITLLGLTASKADSAAGQLTAVLSSWRWITPLHADIHHQTLELIIQYLINTALTYDDLICFPSNDCQVITVWNYILLGFNNLLGHRYEDSNQISDISTWDTELGEGDDKQRRVKIWKYQEIHNFVGNCKLLFWNTNNCL